MKKRYFFVACLLVLMVSCEAFINTVKETFTTANASYVELLMGGIKIKDFEKDGVKPEEAGLVDEDDNVFDTLTFNEPDKDGVMSCNELPLEFLKISDIPGKRRSVAPSRYAGTWEAIVPMPQGFRKIFLDLKNGGKCSLYFDLFPSNDVKVKTDVETVLEGTFTDIENQNAYLLKNIRNRKGYAKSIIRFAKYLQKTKDDTLTAMFKVKGQYFVVRLFKLSTKEGARKTYVGVGDFSEDKVGSVITLELEGDNFTLKIPKGTKLPMKFTR